MTDEPVIETSGLTKRYGEATSPSTSLALRVRRGEVYGFLGPNGAGKTTTLRMLLGLVRPTAGAADGPRRAARRPGGPRAARRPRRGARLLPVPLGRDNLRVLAGHAGVSRDRVEAVLPTSG